MDMNESLGPNSHTCVSIRWEGVSPGISFVSPIAACAYDSTNPLTLTVHELLACASVARIAYFSVYPQIEVSSDDGTAWRDLDDGTLPEAIVTAAANWPFGYGGLLSGGGSQGAMSSFRPARGLVLSLPAIGLAAWESSGLTPLQMRLVLSSDGGVLLDNDVVSWLATVSYQPLFYPPNPFPPYFEPP